MKGALDKTFVLIVEDDEGIHENLRILLEFNDYRVKVAKNGNDALKQLLDLQKLSVYPDLILCDIIMPEMNGYDLFRILSMNSNWNTIPFIFLSALSYPEDIQLAKSLGVDDYITKPFKEEELLSLIKDKLEKNKKIGSTNSKDNNNSLKSLLDENNSLIMFHITLNANNDINICNTYPYSKAIEKFVKIIGKKFIQSDNVKIETFMDDLNQTFFYSDFNNLNIQGSFLLDYKAREKDQKYILGVFSDNMSYFDSLNIKKIIREISVYINIDKKWNNDLYYQKLMNLFKMKSNLMDNLNYVNIIDSHSALK